MRSVINLANSLKYLLVKRWKLIDARQTVHKLPVQRRITMHTAHAQYHSFAVRRYFQYFTHHMIAGRVRSCTPAIDSRYQFSV